MNLIIISRKKQRRLEEETAEIETDEPLNSLQRVNQNKNGNKKDFIEKKNTFISQLCKLDSTIFTSKYRF